MNLFQNRIVIGVTTAAVAALTSLINQHVIPADIGIPILSAIGAFFSGHGASVITSGKQSAASKPVVASVATTVAPAPGPVVLPQVPAEYTVPGNAP